MNRDRQACAAVQRCPKDAEKETGATAVTAVTANIAPTGYHPPQEFLSRQDQIGLQAPQALAFGQPDHPAMRPCDVHCN